MGSVERSMTRKARQKKAKEHPKTELHLSIAQRFVILQVGNQHANPSGQGATKIGIRKMFLIERDLKTEEAREAVIELEEDHGEATRAYRKAMAIWAQARQAADGEEMKAAQEGLPAPAPFDDPKPTEPKLDLEAGGTDVFQLRTSTLQWLKDAFNSPKVSMGGSPEMLCDLMEELGIEWDDEDVDDDEPEPETLAEADAEEPAPAKDTVKLTALAGEAAATPGE